MAVSGGFYPTLRSQPASALTRINERHWLANDLLFIHSGHHAFWRGRPIMPQSTPTIQEYGLGGTGNPSFNHARGFKPDGTNYDIFDVGENLALPLTLSVWNQGVNGTSFNSLLSVRRALGLSGGVSLRRTNAEALYAISMQTSTTQASATSTGVFTGLQWTHGVAVFASIADRRIYQDGGGKATDTVSRTFPTDCNRIAVGLYIDAANTPAGVAVASIALPMVVGRVLDDDEIVRLHEEQRSNPWLIFQERKIWVPVTSSTGTTYTITPSGGVSFAGTNTVEHTKVFSASGNITFSGTNSVEHQKTQVVSGTISFSGTAPLTLTNGATEYIITPTGTITYSGSALELKTKTYAPSGTINFNGTNAVVKDNVYAVSGGVTLSGNAPLSFVPFGSVTVTTRLPLTGVGQ